MHGALRLVRARWRALLPAISLLVLSAPVVPVQAATTGTMQTYLVLYKTGASTSSAAALVQGAGGQLVYNYTQIGVVIARSDRSDFAANIRRASGVEGASATTRFATRLDDQGLDTGGATAVAVDTPTTGGDNLSGLQWDMSQIGVFDAHAITGGSSSVLVGDIDTGLDYTHPDLAAIVDSANSVNCLTGNPVPGAVAAADDNGHGTHTAGTIAAAANRIGIVGVAPNVRIAGIKAGDADGFFFPEAVVCAFMWAGKHGFNVTNNSYFADPWYFNCKNDPEQRAIWKAERRAISFAISKGVAVVAAEGNFSDDLAHPTRDTQSPDDTTPTTRSVSNDCAVVPVEVAGVVGVTADGNKLMKTYYSSYGMGSVQVVAPGGDRRFQVTADAVNGRVLSTWPSYIGCPAALKVVDGGATYCYLQGTSMASPHVAGLAALIASLGTTSPGAITARLGNTADAMSCPTDYSTPVDYVAFPSVANGAPQLCTGGPGYNSWYGHGQVNALSAVS